MMTSLPPVLNGQEISDDEIATMERALLAHPFTTKADRQYALREFSLNVQALRSSRQQFRAKWANLATLQLGEKRSWPFPAFINIPRQWLRWFAAWLQRNRDWWTDVSRLRSEVAMKPSRVKSIYIRLLECCAWLQELFAD